MATALLRDQEANPALAGDRGALLHYQTTAQFRRRSNQEPHLGCQPAHRLTYDAGHAPLISAGWMADYNAGSGLDVTKRLGRTGGFNISPPAALPSERHVFKYHRLTTHFLFD